MFHRNFLPNKWYRWLNTRHEFDSWFDHTEDMNNGICSLNINSLEFGVNM